MASSLRRCQREERGASESVFEYHPNVGSHACIGTYLSGSDNDRGNFGNFVQASVDDNGRGSNAKVECSIELDG